MLDPVPHAAFEIDVAGRYRVRPNAFGRELIRKSLHVVNECRLEYAVRAGGEIDLAPRYTRYRDDRRRLARFEPGHGRIHEIDRAEQIGLELLAPRFEIVAGSERADVGHHDIEP